MLKAQKTKPRKEPPHPEKAKYGQYTANLIHNGERPNIPLTSGTRQACLLSSLLLNVVVEGLTIAVR